MQQDVAELREAIKRFLEQVESAGGERPLPESRRSAWRYTWTAFAKLESDDPSDTFEPLYITTSFISVEGLNFRSPRMFERGCKVLVSLETDEGELRIPATVMHATESVGMPVVGVKFDL